MFYLFGKFSDLKIYLCLKNATKSFMLCITITRKRLRHIYMFSDEHNHYNLKTPEFTGAWTHKLLSKKYKNEQRTQSCQISNSTPQNQSQWLSTKYPGFPCPLSLCPYHRHYILCHQLENWKGPHYFMLNDDTHRDILTYWNML